ncbi:MAG TPA: hypothetical protein PLD02_16735, partial [Saprospiraceae bacterium]|nr:hypothetical protein [Saprospiraceae bacterium]
MPGPGRPKKIQSENKKVESKSLGDDFAADIACALKKTATQKISFVDFLTNKDFCNLKLSSVVRAIAEASEGTVPTEIDNALCQQIFKCNLNDLKGKKHRVIVVGAGQRGGKTSRLLAPKAV